MTEKIKYWPPMDLFLYQDYPFLKVKPIYIIFVFLYFLFMFLKNISSLGSLKISVQTDPVL